MKINRFKYYKLHKAQKKNQKIVTWSVPWAWLSSMSCLGATVVAVFNVIVVHGHGTVFAVTTAAATIVVSTSAINDAASGCAVTSIISITASRCCCSCGAVVLHSASCIEYLYVILYNFTRKLAVLSRFLLPKMDI